MRDYNEAMVDIETLDTGPESIVYQVGIIIFRNEDLLFNKEFDMELQQQLDFGRTVTEATLKFHMQSPMGVARSLNAPLRTDISELERALNQIANTYRPKYWWSKGDFDYKILESMLNTIPWAWHQKMELRTLIRELPVEKLEASHTALQDCLIQYSMLNQCRRLIDAIQIPEDGAGIEGEEGDQQGSPQADPK